MLQLEFEKKLDSIGHLYFSVFHKLGGYLRNRPKSDAESFERFYRSKGTTTAYLLLVTIVCL